jgi:hypothetical protein
MADAVQFAFILVLPIVVVAGALVTLFAVGALFDALDHPDEVGERIAAAFRSAAVKGRETGARHYYQPYWKG